jgi:glycosyltransferase involved in cell wall biosynthesis
VLSEDGPRLIGIDACSLGVHRTGVANYVAPILSALVEAHPKTDFVLYSNAPVRFSDYPNVRVRVTDNGRRGPLWQTGTLAGMLRADGVEAHWGTNGYLPALGMRRIGTVVTIHDLAEVYAPATQQRAVRWSRRLAQHLAARQANRVVAVSQATADAVNRHYGAKVQAVVHPCVADRFGPVAPETARAVAARYGLDGPYLLIVGTLEPRKNVVTTIRAYLARKAAGRDLPPLALVGGGGWLNEEIETVIGEGLRAGHIRRLGYVPDEDLPALYAACHAFMMPSVYEGFGMPITEAQACGAPVIHGSHGSMVEAGGGLGVSVEPTAEGIGAVFDRLAEGGAGLACRLPADMGHTPAKAAATMWRMLCEAARYDAR